jgi:hypothetical protein
MGEEQHSVELTNTNKIYFYFDDKEYTYVSSYGSAFFSIEEADSFFNSCLSLLNHPYSDGDLLYFEMNGLSVYRNNSMLAKKYGFKKPILIIYDDKAWTIIQKSKIKSIIQSLNSVK